MLLHEAKTLNWIFFCSAKWLLWWAIFDGRLRRLQSSASLGPLMQITRNDCAHHKWRKDIKTRTNMLRTKCVVHFSRWLRFMATFRQHHSLCCLRLLAARYVSFSKVEAGRVEEMKRTETIRLRNYRNSFFLCFRRVLIIKLSAAIIKINGIWKMSRQSSAELLVFFV